MEMSDDLTRNSQRNQDNYLEALTGDECRLCLQKSKESWPLFQSNDNQLPQKIMACAAVQILEGDGLPSTICSQCNRLLELSYNFKLTVEKTDSKLRSLSYPKPIIVFTESLSHPLESIPKIEDRLISQSLESSHLLQLNSSIDNTIIFRVEDLKPDKDSQVVLLEKLDEFDDHMQSKDFFQIKTDILEPSARENFKDLDKNSSEKKSELINKKSNLMFICHICTEQFNCVEKLKEHVTTHDSLKGSNSCSDHSVDDHLINDNSIDHNSDSDEISVNDDQNSLNNHQNLLNDIDSENLLNNQACIDQNLDQNLQTQNLVQNFKNQNLDQNFKNQNLVQNLDQNLQTQNLDQNLVQNLEAQNLDQNLQTQNLDQNLETQNLIIKKSSKYKCKFCPKQFTYEKSYQTHAKSHKDPNHQANSDEEDQDPEDDLPEGLQCLQCGKLFATKRNLKRHISTHTGVKFNCETCSKEFSRLDKLKEHEYAKHSADFTDSDEDKPEKESKELKKNRPHKCSLCPKAFAQQQSLNNHLERHKRVKDTQKRFLCDVCSKCFAQSGSLVAHMRTHTGVKPYVCSVCSRAFTKSTYLQLHLRTHSGEKPYICQYCSRAFARANTLARHITMHTGEAKYHCQICRKSFRRLTSLNEHTYTHTGQRPYACKICTKRYNNAGSLYAHTKKCKAQNGAKEVGKETLPLEGKAVDPLALDESFTGDNKEFKAGFFNIYPSM
ncbi:hypothetical protein KQX54_003187 [Cotesia glomerata]|uniref:Uncharacterized protein n=1 Tax=Cotesia glomerata TaxID=32391 RepID=A0AAV7HB55_COTGL|nr:hypothetical protein KQX54_003187 [Cotesia glomerata]